MPFALVLKKPSYPPTLEWTEVDPTPLGPWDVRVTIRAASLNPVDWKIAAQDFPGWDRHRIIGVDGSGIISEVGTSVQDWKQGERVFFHGDLSRPGTLAQETVVDSRVLTWLPDEMSFEQGAALPCAGLTAYQGLFRKARVQRDESLLVYGVAGGVGGFALQLGIIAGLRVVGLCNSSKMHFANSLIPPEGGRYQILSRDENWEEKAKVWNQNQGFDNILSATDSETLKKDLGRLTYGGHLISAAGPVDLSAVEPFGPSPSVHEVALGACYSYSDPRFKKELGTMGRELAALVIDGKVNPMITEVLVPNHVSNALVRIREGKTMGKLVVLLV